MTGVHSLRLMKKITFGGALRGKQFIVFFVMSSGCFVQRVKLFYVVPHGPQDTTRPSAKQTMHFAVTRFTYHSL